MSTPQHETKIRIDRTESYAEKIRKEFNLTVNRIIDLNKRIPALKQGQMFSFATQPRKIQNQVEELLKRLHSVVKLAIERGVELEWKIANKECDKLISSLIGQKVVGSDKFTAWTSHNMNAMQAFISRSDNGLNLSNRVWKAVEQLRDEMEVAITVAIGEGKSASKMSQDIRQYLNDPDLMFRRFRYKDENGVWRKKWKKRVSNSDGTYKFIDCDKDSYHTGQGVYKSAAKNAMRVARTETNIAYRTANHERWQGMDFVLGQNIQLSNAHPKKDICDKLAGAYPKSFKFTGWHPQCFCFVTPILMSEDEMKKVFDAKLEGKQYIPKGEQIKDVPQAFKDYVVENAENIDKMRENGTEPYFLRDNEALVDKILSGKETSEQVQQERPLTALEKARIRHEARTPEQVAEIKRKWAERLEKRALLAEQKAWGENIAELENALGVKCGKPMTFEEANEMRANPHYIEDYVYRNNCQSAVIANELRRRGFDVEAFEYDELRKSTMPYFLAKAPFCAWVDKTGNAVSPILLHNRDFDIVKGKLTFFEPATKKMLYKQFEQATKEAGRYHISFKWVVDDEGGHILTAERLHNGTLRIYDPQSGKVATKRKELPFDVAIDLNWEAGVKILRVDNLRLNADVVRGVVKEAGIKGRAGAIDMAQEYFLKKVEKRERIKILGNNTPQKTKDLQQIDCYNSRELFREKQSEARQKLLQQEHTKLKSDNIYSKRLYFGKNEKKSLIAHCFNATEIEAVSKLPLLLKTLKNGRYEPINMKRKNYKEKIKSGVRNFVVYDIEIDGIMFELKCEAIKNNTILNGRILEHPYSLKIKRE